MNIFQLELFPEEVEEIDLTTPKIQYRRTHRVARSQIHSAVEPAKLASVASRSIFVTLAMALKLARRLMTIDPTHLARSKSLVKILG